jgi:hypothetical protein
VMATCAHNGQAVGVAAALCTEQGLLPRDLVAPNEMRHLQQKLLRTGQYIPGVAGHDDTDLAQHAHITASSTLRVHELSPSGELAPADTPRALLLPLPAGRVPVISLCVDVSETANLHAELWRSSRPGNTTPELLLASVDVMVEAGREQLVRLDFQASLEEQLHVFVVVPNSGKIAFHQSVAQAPGILTVSQKMNSSVAKSAIQTPPAGSGVDTFPFWLPDRRPSARNLAVRFSPPLEPYSPDNVINGLARPWRGANAWVPEPSDPNPTLRLSWDTPQILRSIEIVFDTDTDHPMESVLLTHPERVMPGCITSYRIVVDEEKILAEVSENHQTRRTLTLADPVTASNISIQILSHGEAPPAIFEVRCY